MVKDYLTFAKFMAWNSSLRMLLDMEILKTQSLT